MYEYIQPKRREDTGLNVRPVRSLKVLQPSVEYFILRVGKTVTARSERNSRLLTSGKGKIDRKWECEMHVVGGKREVGGIGLKRYSIYVSLFSIE
jgi:hypothetical protein